MNVTFEVVVNGASRTAPTSGRLPDLLADLGLAAGSVVVELNGTALTPSEALRVTLSAGDRLELVRAVAGG